MVRRDGPGALTLEAVAAEAGLSKGGLLYHFPTKDDLLDAFLEDWVDRFERDIQAGVSEEGWAGAYVSACALDDPGAKGRATDVAILATLAGDPRRLAILRRRYADWQEQLVSASPDPVEATILRLAGDGLWFAELLGLAPPAGELRDQVLARLGERAREGSPPK